MKYIPARILEAFNGNEDAARNAIIQQDSIWKTGRDLTQGFKSVSMKDAVALPNATILVPHILSQFVREGLEPMLVGTRLLTRIQYQPGMQIQFPALGALTAEDVAPGQSLPEFAPDLGGSAVNEMKVGKSGLALKIFDEVTRYNQYNLVSYWLRLAGQALARHKEKKIFNFIGSMGACAFDNTTRANGVTGRFTSGRNADGTLNGSMTMDDIMEMYALGLQQGFIMDTILVHPLTWLMWLRDPVLRVFQQQYGGGQWFNMWQGDPRNQGARVSSFSPLGEGTGLNVNPTTGNTDAPTATPLGELSQSLSSVPALPNYLGMSFNIIPSPFANFDVATSTCDMIMFNSQNLGALIVDQDPSVLEWSQPDLGLTKMQVAERYGLAILNEGQGIVVAKDVKVTRNYISDESMQATFAMSGTLTDPAASGVTSPL
ncbi:MAG: hypothetical protein E4H01_00085 [Lysobacterales bacterium]|nr:MAG: hypothetical protein E4H01_00085 [Xanthomonadales bacterium]